MSPEVRAVIDVGTNSVKLLVATVDGAAVRPIDEASEQTRLGQGFYESHLLQRPAIERTADAVAAFAEKARFWKADPVRVLATSAVRDARNQEELLREIALRSGLAAEVISGGQEADWAFEGVASDPRLGSGALLVIDIGGGSTEFTAGRKGARVFGQSFRLGTVRYLEAHPSGDPPGEAGLGECAAEARRILEEQVQPGIAEALASLGGPPEFIVTGGTSTIVARIHRRLRSFNRELIDGVVVTGAELDEMTRRLWSLPAAERRQTIGLPPNRADVILPGTVFIGEVMRLFRLPNMRASTRGLRFGALMG